MSLLVQPVVCLVVCLAVAVLLACVLGVPAGLALRCAGRVPLGSSVTVKPRAVTAASPCAEVPSLQGILARMPPDDQALAALISSRVVFLVNSAELGGAEKHSVNLASWLQRHGVRVLVVCPPRAPILPELVARRVPYREMHLGMTVVRWRGYLGTLAFLTPFNRDKSNRQLLNLARETPSVFVCPFPREQLLTARLAKSHGLRTIWIVHSPLHLTPHRLVLQSMLIRCACSAAAIVSVSNTRAEELLAAGLPSNNLVVIPNAVENAAAAPLPPDAPRERDLVVILSRLVKPKGVQYAIAAMPRVLRARPNARLAIAGSGRYAWQLRRAVHRRGLDEHVEFAGYLAHPEALLQHASLLVFPSVDAGEAMPTVILEAYASGVPVVASPTGGVREIVFDGHTGLLVQPGDPDALADAMIDLLEDPARARQMGASAREFIDSGYTYDHIGRPFMAILAHVDGSCTILPTRSASREQSIMAGNSHQRDDMALLVVSKPRTTRSAAFPRHSGHAAP